MKHDIIGGNFTLADGTPLPLSKATRAGDLVFLSGQLGFDSSGALPEGVALQTECCVKNIANILEEASLDLSNVIKATVWLTDLNDFGAFNKVYKSAFPDSPPARSTVCSQLALRGALVEIEVIAYG
jgi:reactive intermediate/imine deaminase